MIRGPHQSDDYIDAEVSHADHADEWQPGPHNVAHDEDNAMHRAIRRASRPSEERRHGLDLIAERRAGT